METMKIKQSSQFVVNMCFGFEREGGIVRYPRADTMRYPTALGYRKLKGKIITFRMSLYKQLCGNYAFSNHFGAIIRYKDGCTVNILFFNIGEE